ncbi:MAG: hypothetical protein RLZZ127_319 [Planctomycetota bacterium]|jgi:hypothetical protein
MRWLLVVLAWWCAAVASAGGPCADTADERRLIAAGAEAEVCISRQSACFPAGSGSWAPIESVRAGDVVWTRDQGDPSGTLRPGLVARTFVREAGEIRRLAWARTGHGRGGGASGGEDASAAGGEEPPGILATAEHPFWVRGEGWVAAGSLAPGDEVRGASGWWRVVSATTEPWSGRVHNLEVVGGHTYFVGGPSGAVWVHNTCSPLLLMLPQMAFGAGPGGLCGFAEDFRAAVAKNLGGTPQAKVDALRILKACRRELGGKLVPGIPGPVTFAPGSQSAALAKNLGKRYKNHSAHHILPTDVVKDDEVKYLFSGGPGFPGIGLDHNSAWNGIWLPNSRYTKLHSPRSVHAGSHPAYSEPLKSKLKEYASSVQVRIRNGEPLEAVMIDVEKTMQRLNDRLRKALVPPESKALHYNREATQDAWDKILSEVLP